VRWRSGKSRSEEHDGVRLVKVAYARNLAEAELIQGLLRQEHIPSMLQRNAGFDVPDFLVAGARDVLVPVSQADRARELLA
jgi:pimeloyl-ACP methyl ester carboxylesterase